MFDMYANRKAGSSVLADWLNEQGYHAKNGRLWSKESVITVLRNRAYIGEITTEAIGIPRRTNRRSQRAVRQGASNSHGAPRGSLQAGSEPRRVTADRSGTLRALQTSVKRTSALARTDPTRPRPLTRSWVGVRSIWWSQPGSNRRPPACRRVMRATAGERAG